MPSLFQIRASLPAPQQSVFPTLLDELGMWAIFGNLAVGKHDNAVEARNCRQAVSHHDARTASHQAAKRLLLADKPFQIELYGVKDPVVSHASHNDVVDASVFVASAGKDEVEPLLNPFPKSTRVRE